MVYLANRQGVEILNYIHKGVNMRGLILIAMLVALPSFVQADYVSGYYRSDGTYVQGYQRSAPDGDKSNNYGPSDYSGQSPYQRDSDGDGISNMRDRDDDNDGIGDNNDRSQYGY